MNNIEKLAIEHGSTCYTGQQYHFDKWQLEAFAKALQSSEPVAVGKVVNTECYSEVFVDFYDEKPLSNGTELFTHPPASVPLEKYNKLLDALNRLRDCDWVISLPDRMDAVRDIAKQAIAEAEGK